jgi:hypothetical protein
MQVVVIVVVVAALAYIVTGSADNWADWVVLGAIVLTALGGAIAVHQRQYPTKKRTFTRDSDAEW